MSTPAFVALRSRFPDAHITLLTMHSQNADQAAKVRAYAGAERAAPWIDLIRPHAIDEVQILPPVRSLGTLIEGRRMIAKVRPDLVVQMFEPSTPYLRRAAKLALMFALCGPVRQIGWRQPGQILPGHAPVIDPVFGHHVYGPLQFLRELGDRSVLSEEDVVFDIRPGAAAETWAVDWLRNAGLLGGDIVAIAPGAIHDHKQWPLGKFEAVVRALHARFPHIQFLLMGTAKDAPLARALRAIDPARIHDLCGESTIAQSAAIFRHCVLTVGNDGGAMHLADAVGGRVVSIVPGLEFPNSVEPWHNQDRAVRLPVPCSPCYSFTFCPEGHRRCMLDLPVAAVLAQCERALEGAMSTGSTMLS